METCFKTSHLFVAISLVFRELHSLTYRRHLLKTRVQLCTLIRPEEAVPVPLQTGHSEIRPERMLLFPGVNPNRSAIAKSYP